jgi:hypothetical protein
MSRFARYYFKTESPLPAERLFVTVGAPWMAVAVRGGDAQGGPLSDPDFRFQQGGGVLSWNANCYYEMVFSTASIDRSVIDRHLRQSGQDDVKGVGIQFSPLISPIRKGTGPKDPPPPPPEAPFVVVDIVR